MINSERCAEGTVPVGRPLTRAVAIPKYAKQWWAGTGLNRRHQDFQSCALPTELPAHHEFSRIAEGGGNVYKGCYFLPSSMSLAVSDSKTIRSSSSTVKASWSTKGTSCWTRKRVRRATATGCESR